MQWMKLSQIAAQGSEGEELAAVPDSYLKQVA